MPDNEVFVSYSEPKYKPPKLLGAPQGPAPVQPLVPVQRKEEKRDYAQEVLLEEERAKQEDIPVRKTKKKTDKFKIWDLLEWARYPITNMVYHTAEMRDEGFTLDEVGKIFKSGMYGLILKEKKNAADIIRMELPGKKEWVYSVFGAGADVIMDPATYLTLGVGAGLKGAKIGKGAARYAAIWAKKGVIAQQAGKAATAAFTKKVTAKFGGKTIEQAIRNAKRTYKISKGAGFRVGLPFTSVSARLGTGKLYEAAGRGMTRLATTKPVKALTRAFVPFGKLGPGPREVFEKVKIDNVHKMSYAIEVLKKQTDEIGHLDELFKIFDVTAKKTPKIPKKMADDAIKLKDMLDEVWKGLRKRKLIGQEKYVAYYMPRMYYDARNGVVGVIKRKEFTTAAKFMKVRKFPTAKAAEKAGFKLRSAKESLQLYLDQALKVMNNFDTQQEIAKKLGKEIATNRRAGIGLTRLTAKGLTDWVVADDVAAMLNRVTSITIDPNELQKTINYFNRAQNLWKKTATIYWPGFHGRNFWSNEWIGAFKDGIGLKNLDDKTKALKIHLRHLKHPDEMIKIPSGMGKTKTVTLEAAYKELREVGVHTGTWARTELTTAPFETIIGKANASGLKKIFSKPGKIAAEAGSMVENVARSASYYSDLRKGFSPEMAASRVRKFFLDYSNITEVERGIKKVIPFYTWFKYNITNQLTYMITQPGKYSMFTTKALRAVDWADPEQKQYLPEWMLDGLYIQPFAAKWKDQPLMYNPNFPFQDLSKVTRPLKEIGAAITPLLKVPAELALNRSLWEQGPISYGKFDVRDVPVPLMPFVAALEKSDVARMNLNIQRNEAGRLQMPAKWVYALANTIPHMRLGEGIYGAVSGKVPGYREEAAPFDIAARTAGIKFKPLDIQYQKEKHLQDRLKMLKELNKRYGQ